MTYVLKQSLRALCCTKVFQVGQELNIFHQDSPNRVRVMAVGEIGIHKVKASSLRRCSREEQIKDRNNNGK